MSGFSLTPLPLLKGALALCPLPGAGEGAGLADDLAQVQAWGADLVLTLVPQAELAELGASALPQQVARLGMAWRPFPIRDFGVPQGGDWPALSQELRAVLARGGRVMIHCRGGCGRTGMIALRLMLEAGEPPQPALARLRAARPCAIETEAQLAWALRD
ncbi:protein phosphatase [Pseudorhodobacter sp. E13]|uniref:phosphatase domain-containing putative toxin n=1 Tax=Pseudorhodobacter sp. E13 TaxID=2487931 RepID=UPI000F8DABCD|nr:protein-tyrosine phosphatase family protein [Pseudorhodobacter sp. E13]RUS58744.1 protein phosphatase [Pseudorhodobacter sp. E13]